MIGQFGEKYGDQKGRLEDTTCWDARPYIRQPFPLLNVPSETRRTEGTRHESESLAEYAHSDQSFEPELQGSGLPPKLEEQIPDCFLPDLLLVNDLCLCATGKQGQNEDELKYTTVRMKPIVQSRVFKYIRQEPIIGNINRIPSKDLKIASIQLSPDNMTASGSHSSVYKAPLRLPPPLATNSRSGAGEVTVIAKLAFDGLFIDDDREMLEAEASAHSSLARKHSYLQEAWSGYNILEGIDRPVPVGAVLPKFYGYYVPSLDALSKESMLSPVLLMEDCGSPIELKNMSLAEKCVRHSIVSWFQISSLILFLLQILTLPLRLVREEVLSKYLHLQNAEFQHCSCYPRNVLVQPGPLSVHPRERSLKTPSYRLVDLGRFERPDDNVDKWDPQHQSKEVWDERRRRLWRSSCDEQNAVTRRHLQWPRAVGSNRTVY